MIEVHQLETFAAWLRRLRDRRGAARIAERLRRMSLGAMGDAKPVGDGVFEIRIHHGPGYRVYFVQRGDRMIVLLCGGDKGSQPRDIEKAKALAHELEQ